ncbi:MAG: metallophosphoesterase family protein [Halanaerobiaceae bacterium]
MSLKILHTGDIHIGMKFNNYPDYIQKKLIQARYKALENIVSKANETKSNLIVIAGDLFDKINIPPKSIVKVINILNKFSGDCILVLPGNHDFDNGGIELWEIFKENLKGNMVLLDETRKYDLNQFDLEVSIYPAPCDAKHSDENKLDWINKIDNRKDNKFEIGVAHGALSGISPDMSDEYFKMTESELQSLNMDLWLLGHTHLPFPEPDFIENRKIFNCGTPEPDGLDCGHEGSAWFIEIEDNHRIKAEKIKTGNYYFQDLYFQVQNRNDFQQIKNELLNKNPDKKVVRLNLEGRITENLYDRKEEFYSQIKKELAYLSINDIELKIKITGDVIDNEFNPQSFPHQLLTELKDDEKALQIAYEFIREVRK